MNYRTTSRRPRRSRYTVTLAGGARKVILAYSAADARAYYEGRGYVVLAVVAGDKVNVPEDGGWKLTPRLPEAKAFLGLTLPVKIKQTSPVGGRYGCYWLRVDPRTGRPYHHITIKSWLTPEQAGRTLWHELCHAMQAERAAKQYADTAGEGVEFLPPSAWLAAWRQTDERLGSYRTRSIEVEAREYEDFNNEVPLARK